MISPDPDDAANNMAKTEAAPDNPMDPGVEVVKDVFLSEGEVASAMPVVTNVMFGSEEQNSQESGELNNMDLGKDKGEKTPTASLRLIFYQKENVSISSSLLMSKCDVAVNGSQTETSKVSDNASANKDEEKTIPAMENVISGPQKFETQENEMEDGKSSERNTLNEERNSDGNALGKEDKMDDNDQHKEDVKMNESPITGHNNVNEVKNSEDDQHKVKEEEKEENSDEANEQVSVSHQIGNASPNKDEEKTIPVMENVNSAPKKFETRESEMEDGKSSEGDTLNEERNNDTNALGKEDKMDDNNQEDVKMKESPIIGQNNVTEVKNSEDDPQKVKESEEKEENSDEANEQARVSHQIGNDLKVESTILDVRAGTSGKKKKVLKKKEKPGMIFMCSKKTKQDCFDYKVFGLPAKQKDVVCNISKGMRLFLFDTDLRVMYGIYEAAAGGGYKIEPKAFNSAFPSQVQFTVVQYCMPLAEENFRLAIKDNYYRKNRFNCQLTSEQVNKLSELFVAASKCPSSNLKIDNVADTSQANGTPPSSSDMDIEASDMDIEASDMDVEEEADIASGGGIGMIFMCNSKTKEDCYHYRVLGLPANRREIVQKIHKGMRLFMFDVDLRVMHGIYKAAEPGGYNIEPKAFDSCFPSQVRFTVVKECLPLTEDRFKEAIIANYYKPNKFNCQLTSEQANNLSKIFLAATGGLDLSITDYASQSQATFSSHADNMIADGNCIQPFPIIEEDFMVENRSKESIPLQEDDEGVENSGRKEEANPVGKSGKKRKRGRKRESTGMIFMCNSQTKQDCLYYKVFGLPANKRETVEKIHKGTRLFLFDADLRVMYGIYEAAGPGGYNIEPRAFNSRFPSQVEFTVVRDCMPLGEDLFKEAIKDNYYTNWKFSFELTAQQVKNLCELFTPANLGLDITKRPKLENRDTLESMYGGSCTYGPVSATASTINTG